MSQLVAVASPTSGREMLERAAMLRRTFFPRRDRFVPNRIIPRIVYREPLTIPRRPRAVIVYAVPVEISMPPSVAAFRAEIAEVAALVGRRIRVALIIKAASEHFGISAADIVSHRRFRAISRPRQVVMHLAKELSGRSLPDLGRLLGGKDHTTILHGIRKIKALIEANDPIAADVEAIRARLLA